MGVFADHAALYTDKGFRVFPTGKDAGKVPLIRGWQKVGRKAAIALAKQFPDANIGVIDGDKVTRIDIDDPELIDGSIRRFGDTPVKVGTPSGGLHLWYAANGERRRTGLEGQKIDLLGKGGFGVAPPSVNSGVGVYRFLEGGLDDVDLLPLINPGALPPKVYSTYTDGLRTPVSTMRGVLEGQRNNALFSQCLRYLKDGHDPELLAWSATAWNEGFVSPLTETEVQKTVASAVRYQVEGNNWVGGSGVLKTTRAAFDAFGGDADAMCLDACLRFYHGSRAEPFAISPTGMEAGGILPGWGKARYRNTRNRLEGMGRIYCVHRGKGPGNPNLYFLGE